MFSLVLSLTETPAIYIIAVTPASYGALPSNTGAYAALYASCVGFILLTSLLLFLSGLPLQERPGAKKRYEKGEGWPEYQKYLNDTSILIPMPQAVWRKLPVIVKRTIGCEWRAFFGSSLVTLSLMLPTPRSFQPRSLPSPSIV